MDTTHSGDSDERHKKVKLDKIPQKRRQKPRHSKTRPRKTDRLTTLVGYRINLNNGKTIRLTRVLFRSHILSYRGTMVAEAECLCTGEGCNEAQEGGCKWRDSDFVIKISFPSKSREAEHDLILHALEMADREDEWVKKNLPEVMHAETHHDHWDADHPRHDLVQYLRIHSKREREGHVMRIVIQKKLCPLRELNSAEELAQVFFDVLQCHRWLYEKPRILHRDISERNIMFCRDKENAVHGVLIDFDMSSTVDETQDAPSSQQSPTGTRPYLAYDLFDPSWTRGNMYRHDLESLFYVILCTTCRYRTLGRLLSDPPYQVWFNIEPDRVWNDKANQVILKLAWDPPVTEYFAEFRTWLMSLQSMISLGYVTRVVAAKSKSVFNEENLGSHITYDGFVSTMSEFGGKKLLLRSSGRKAEQETLATATIVF